MCNLNYVKFQQRSTFLQNKRKIFSTLDLKAGYWQMPMQESDIEKTAFVCEARLYEFQRMPFGLTSAPVHYE